MSSIFIGLWREYAMDLARLCNREFSVGSAIVVSNHEHFMRETVAGTSIAEKRVTGQFNMVILFGRNKQ